MTRTQASINSEGKASTARTAITSACLTIGLIAGCSKGAGTTGAPAPASPAPSNATAYVGTQAPGLWTLSIDDLQKVFSYQALASTSAVSGALRIGSGVLDLRDSNSAPIARAVELPGVGALLRPGGVATFPVAMVQQGDCIPIAEKTRYIYAALPGPTPQNGTGGSQSTGFGTFVLSSSADGKSLDFTDVHNYVLTSFLGGTLSADTENGHDPKLFSAACASVGGIGIVTADPNADFLPNTSGAPAVPSFHFNAAGAFTEDRMISQDGGWVGFVMPTGAIKAGSVGAGNYRGFFSETTDKIAVDTEPVAFAQATDGTTALAGGTFPNDDLTQAPGSEYTITLGAQDSTYNGVFPNARLIVADTQGLCSSVSLNDATVQASFDVNGRIICTAAGVGVVSQVNGKYVVYFTSHDGTRSTSNQSYVIQFYLYQQ